jgi:hypothetical protein
LLKMVRSTAGVLHQTVCAKKGWDDAPRLGLSVSFDVQYKSAKKLVQPKHGRCVCWRALRGWAGQGWARMLLANTTNGAQQLPAAIAR